MPRRFLPARFGALALGFALAGCSAGPRVDIACRDAWVTEPMADWIVDDAPCPAASAAERSARRDDDRDDRRRSERPVATAALRAPANPPKGAPDPVARDDAPVADAPQSGASQPKDDGRRSSMPGEMATAPDKPDKGGSHDRGHGNDEDNPGNSSNNNKPKGKRQTIRSWSDLNT